MTADAPMRPDRPVAYHWPRIYRYRVADPGFRCAWNQYPGVRIGAAVVVGRYAYCVKWASL